LQDLRSACRNSCYLSVLLCKSCWFLGLRESKLASQQQHHHHHQQQQRYLY
jgi:hypothetical protein